MKNKVIDEIIDVACIQLEEHIKKYKESQEHLDYYQGVLTGLWELTDSIKNRLIMNKLENDRLNNLVNEANELLK